MSKGTARKKAGGRARGGEASRVRSRNLRDAPESGKRTERTTDVVLAVAGICLGVVTALDQLRDRRTAAQSLLIVGLVILALAIFLFAGWGRQLSARRARFTVTAIGCLPLATGLAILLLTSNGVDNTIHAPLNKLLWQLTAPDESNTCGPAGMLVGTGITADSPKPGKFALTPGSQLSLLLQASQSSSIVVTHIRTIIDHRSRAFNGRYVDITPGCQGSVDERFYLASFGAGSSDVKPRAVGHITAAPPPLTVSSQDPVVVYISIPQINGSLYWHIRLTWVVDGREFVSNIGDHGKPLIASSHSTKS
jgi:hypothetical protein